MCIEKKKKIAWIDDKEERGMLGREAKNKMAQCDTTTGRSDEKNKRNKGGKRDFRSSYQRAHTTPCHHFDDLDSGTCFIVVSSLSIDHLFKNLASVHIIRI